MVILNVKSELIVNPKTCDACKQEVPTTDKVYYGHSNFRPKTKDCSSYICEKCVTDQRGYVAECDCWRI